MTDKLREAIAEQISEGLGAILRKFCDSPEAKQARHYLHAMPKSDWDTLIGMLAEESAGAARAALAAAPQPEDSEDCYKLGYRDGYEQAVQDCDLLTGGDGVYVASTIGNDYRDPAAMKRRMRERWEAQAAPQPARPGQRMIHAAEEAVAIARGEAEPASVYPAPQPEDSEDIGANMRQARDDAAAAYLSRGLRLPVPETMAWAVVGRDGQIKHVTGNGRNLARQWAEPGDSIERVAIRVVDDAEGGA